MIPKIRIKMPEKEDTEKWNCLNLGCGKQQIADTKDMTWINIDKSPQVNPNMVFDLEQGLPWLQHKIIDYDKIDMIFINHFLEHVSNPLFLLAQCWMALKVDGCIHITVPNGADILHPGHKSFFSAMWFTLLDPEHGEHHEIKDLVGDCAFIIENHNVRGVNWKFKNVSKNGEELTIVLKKVGEKNEG